MRNVFFIPPLKKMSGGLANIYDLASLLAESGRDVALCHMDKATPGLADMGHINTLAWDDCRLEPGDLWCLPEGWPNALPKGADAGARPLIYAQNWAYMLGVLPEGIHWGALPAQYLAVSAPVAWFMRDILGLSVDKILPPVVRDCFFCKNSAPSARKVVRIACMPRKNSAMLRQIRLMSTEILARQAAAPRLDWVEIHAMTQPEAAAALSTCHIFLAASMAEGFGLPPAEAMAAGCVPVGFAGLGGWEYMRSTPLSPCHAQVTASLPPGLALENKAWGPNGFYAPEGDAASAALALAAAVRLAASGAPEWAELVEQGRLTAQNYTREAMRRQLENIWEW